MAVQILDGQILIVTGSVAMHADCCCDPTCCNDVPAWTVTWSGEGDDSYGDTWNIINQFGDCSWGTGAAPICTYFHPIYGTVTVRAFFNISWDSVNGWSAAARIYADYGAFGTTEWERTYEWEGFSFDTDLTCVGTSFVLAIGDATVTTVGSPEGCMTELLTSVTFDGTAP